MEQESVDQMVEHDWEKGRPDLRREVQRSYVFSILVIVFLAYAFPIILVFRSRALNPLNYFYSVSGVSILLFAYGFITIYGQSTTKFLGVFVKAFKGTSADEDARGMGRPRGPNFVTTDGSIAVIAAFIVLVTSSVMIYILTSSTT